ncbi:hypothetical protein AAVH_33813 [Aphelenchoides avenae]|nr:hypothetical protein AAVH_33813 [Aphelenchus avenae]
MCRERCGDGQCESQLFAQELKACLKDGQKPTVTNADVNCCGGSYVGPQFEVTLPSGRTLWMRMCDAVCS